MTKEDFSQYLVETQGFTPEQANQYITEVGLEPGIQAMEEQAKVMGATATPVKAPGTDLLEGMKAAGFGAMDTLTLDNIKKLQSEATRQKKFSLEQDYPAMSLGGKLAGNIPLMMGPGGAVSKVPALAKVLGTGGKALLADIAGGAAMGGLYGAAQNPNVESPDQEMSARVENALGWPALIGAGAATIPAGLRKGGETYYKSAFGKLDAAAKVFNAENAEAIAAGTMKAAEIPSQVMLERGYTGSAPTLLGKIKAGLLKDALPTLQKTREELGNVYQYPVDELKSTVMKSFDDPTKRTASAGAIKKAQGYATEVFDKYTPEGWMKNLRNYVNKRKGYEKEKAAFEAFGGAGDQLPIDNLAAQRTFKPGPKVVELQGKPANTMTAEPYDPSYVQQPLIDLPVLPEDRFNPLRAEKDLLGLSQRKSLADTFNRAMSESPINDKRMTSQGINNLKTIISDVKKKRIDVKQGNALIAAEFNKIMQQGPKQAEILNTGLVDKTYDIANNMPYEVGNFGQQSMPITPQAPTLPRKLMKVSDFNRNLTDIGKVTSDKGFAPISPGETGDVLRQQISQGLYTPLTNFENKVVGEKLGPEVLKKFKAAKEETSRMYNMFPDLKDQALKESGQVQFTPLDIMYLTNPYTAAYAGIKEGAQILQNPGPATTIGKGMIRLGKSKIAPTNLTPALLNMFKAEKKKNLETYPDLNAPTEENTDGN